MKTEQINKLIVEALQKPKAKSCSCGCGTCSSNDAPILTESKVKNILSEGLQHHIDNKIPLYDTIYRYSSDQHLSLIKEAKKLYSRGIIDLAEGDKQLIETNLGEFGMFEGEAVPLDLPMMNEREDALGVYDDNKGNSAYINRASVGFIADIDGEYDFQIGPTATMEELIKMLAADGFTNKVFESKLNEYSEYGGREVQLNKPKRGGSKAYYVYVKDPRSKKVKKVQFGSGGLRAKIKDKDARSAYAARHRCSKKKDRTTPGYWSCNLPRYAKALKLGNNINTFW
jgi:hypothetical protein